MKMLKIWGWFLLTCAVVLYGIGVFTRPQKILCKRRDMTV